ncbi:hypothetical protein EJB05_02729 [Eragrostis curvula]|uniref:Amino acid transporter transmembrane domain-containing protein n=1 Tax=Eragrostis curvula TaxID=38414 RepID=A0A5J9WT80_9POAL|nr:hypothetical protein EJB05_02729 [Eragrostis curvula]
MLPRPQERCAVRVRAVREPVGHARRLHHHRKHQHDRGASRELLPPRGLRRRRLHHLGSTYMVVFGLFQLLLSQLPSLHNIAWLSVVAVATSLGYSFISLGLCAAKWASHGGAVRGTLAGVFGAAATPPRDKAFNVLLALGNMAFSYTFADVLIEIQDTLRSPPAENKTMKRASRYGLGITTVFYLLLGCTGYAAFGDDAPGNILNGMAFYEPFWLVDLANVCVIVHLIMAYQVFAQPIFARLESFVACRWPDAKLINATYYVRLPATSRRRWRWRR